HNLRSFPTRRSSDLSEKPHVSIHPFCFETYYPDANMHARHFSSPFSGTTEDPVTGTASGIMGAYFVKYIHNNSDHPLNLIVEQRSEEHTSELQSRFD